MAMTMARPWRTMVAMMVRNGVRDGEDGRHGSPFRAILQPSVHHRSHGAWVEVSDGVAMAAMAVLQGVHGDGLGGLMAGFPNLPTIGPAIRHHDDRHGSIDGWRWCAMARPMASQVHG